MRRAAAFFDLDRTLLSRSSTLALAGSFRRYGVIGRRQLLKAALWHVVFAARGASAETVWRAAEEGLFLLRGFPTASMRRLVDEAIEPVLRPLVYREAIELAEEHRSRGESTFIVSGALQEVVDALAADLGFDGAIGTVCEVVGGVYTGQPVRACLGAVKADVIRELADVAALDLDASTAYSDSYTDLPFLEAVGNPIAVNPDRELRRIAAERGWRVLEFRERLAGAA